MKEKSNKKSFKEKLKDKKYKAKLELAGYGILILIVFIGANIKETPTNTSLDNSIIPNTTENTKKEEDNLLLKINDNYEYDIKIDYKEQVDEKENTYLEHYYGKACTNNLIINKEVNNNKAIYYKATNEYYKKKTDGNQGFDLIEQDEVYDNIANKYIELDSLKKYLDIASLDHVTNYSNGLREEVYHLNVNDVIKTHKEEKVIEISISMENEKIYIKIDYSNLYKEINPKIKECIVNITYNNIDKVEKFDVIKDNEN